MTDNKQTQSLLQSGNVHKLDIGSGLYFINLLEVAHIEIEPQHPIADDDPLLYTLAITFSGCLQPGLSLSLDMSNDFIQKKMENFLAHYQEAHIDYE